MLKEFYDMLPMLPANKLGKAREIYNDWQWMAAPHQFKLRSGKALQALKDSFSN